MNGEVVSTETASAPWHTFGELDTGMGSTSPVWLVPGDATEDSHQWRTRAFRDPTGNIIWLANARPLEEVAGVVDSCATVNKSTPPASIPRQLGEQLDRLCLAAHDEQFEAGVESRFSRGLQQLCAYDPTSVLQALRARLTDNDASSEVLAEILQWASRQEADAIRALVVDLLSTGLHHMSSLVRDAAASGLAYLDEGAAVSHLRQAIAREKVPELRQDLEDLICSLES